MVGLLTWVLVGITLYTVIAIGLKACGYFPEYISLSGPLMTIHTQRGRKLLDWLAQPKRFWRAWGNIGVGIAVVVMALSGVIVVLTSLYAAAAVLLTGIIVNAWAVGAGGIGDDTREE